MTRMRRGRSDWETFSPRRRRETLAGLEALASGKLAEGDEAAARAARKPGRRGRRIEAEAAEARHLAVLAARTWWWPYFTRLEHRTENWREADERAKEGAKVGLPDVMLLIPAMPGGRPDGTSTLVLAAVELKAPRYRPKSALPERWWLDPWPEDAASRHGLRREQAFWLRVAYGCGFDTFVAYSGAEAFSWLNRRAGPKPAS